jgi:DNA-binding response OmpR family regulator
MYLKQFCDGAKPISRRPCLVFLDVNMPSLSGFDVLAWARQQTALRGMKILMLSGATEPWDSKIAAKLGADDYLVKFPNAEQLTAILRDHLHPTRSRERDPAGAR